MKKKQAHCILIGENMVLIIEIVELQMSYFRKDLSIWLCLTKRRCFGQNLRSFMSSKVQLFCEGHKSKSNLELSPGGVKDLSYFDQSHGSSKSIRPNQEP